MTLLLSLMDHRLHPFSPEMTLLHFCIAVDAVHSGPAEQSKKAEVLGKHISDCVSLQDKEDTGRWTFKGGSWWKGHFSCNRNEDP